MASLAENLKPPFYAAIMNEEASLKTYDDEITPADEMVSIAPRQPGFLGLETTADKDGRQVIITYWRDLKAELAWEHRGDNEIRKHFDGRALKDSCAIRVSKIDHKVGKKKTLRADIRSIDQRANSTPLVAFLIGLIPSVAGLRRHEAIQ